MLGVVRQVDGLFQHTAARRRLLIDKFKPLVGWIVSTHSRPKAAAQYIHELNCFLISFNTQPPEGGCYSDPVDPVYF